MLLQIFSVHDSKAGAYFQPFFQQTEGMAIRIFSDLATDPDHSFNKHPEDFTLFRLGVYNDQNGEFTGEKTPHPICKAIDFAVNLNDKDVSQ